MAFQQWVGCIGVPTEIISNGPSFVDQWFCTFCSLQHVPHHMCQACLNQGTGITIGSGLGTRIGNVISNGLGNQLGNIIGNGIGSVISNEIGNKISVGDGVHIGIGIGYAMTLATQLATGLAMGTLMGLETRCGEEGALVMRVQISRMSYQVKASACCRTRRWMAQGRSMGQSSASASLPGGRGRRWRV